MKTTVPFRLVLCGVGCLLASAAAAQASCLDDAQQLARDYRLPPLLSTPDTARGSAPATGEAPMTDESRGLTAGPDTQTNSGGTAPPAETTRGPSGNAVELGAADRAKLEGLLAQARTAAAQGRMADCAKMLDDARALARPHGTGD